MKKSILQNDMSYCFYCGRHGSLHKHHIFYGSANRKKSEEYGCFVALCPAHHNMGNEAVHYNKSMDIALKKRCQYRFEELYGHEKFMEVFNRNYIE